MTDKNTDNDKGQSQVILETRPRTKKPSMYKVIMLNDDYTPMEFVYLCCSVSSACPAVRRRPSC